MRELRARDVTVPNEAGLTELRCPEKGCHRLLIRFRQANGESLIETFCKKPPGCGTRAEWRLQPGKRPVYTVTNKHI